MDRPKAWFQDSVLAAVAMAFVLRVLMLALVDTQPVTDFAWYFDRAAELSIGRGYAVEGVPTAYWPVGYPAFLALFFAVLGPQLWLAKALGLVLGCAVVWLTGLVGRALIGHWAGVYGSWIVALFPPAVAYTGVLASEPLFTVLSLWFVLLLARKPAGWLHGIVLALATFVRPQGLLLGIVALAIRREQVTWRGLAACAGVFALAHGVWMARNLTAIGTPAFVSTNGGDNLLIGHWPGADGGYENPAALLPNYQTYREADRERKARGLAIFYIKQSPLRSASLVGPKLSETFVKGTDSAYWAYQTEPGLLSVPGTGQDKGAYLFFKSAGQVCVPVLTLVGCAGLVWGTAKKRPGALLCLAIVGYIALVSAIFFGNPRFGYPAVPFFALGAALLLRRKAGEVDLQDRALL